MKKIVFIWLFLLPLWLSAQELWCPEPTNRLVNDYSGVLSSQERFSGQGMIFEGLSLGEKTLMIPSIWSLIVTIKSAPTLK